MPGAAGHIHTTTSAVPAARNGAPRGAMPPATRPWQDTPLGAPQTWGSALRAVIDLVLASPVAMTFTFGDEHTMVYNDAFAGLLGTRHPAAFGQPAPVAFADVWHTQGMGDVVERVYRTGESHLDAESATSTRQDAPEQVFFTRGCSAVRDASGRIIGTLSVVVTEPTGVTRGLQSLSELTSALAGTLTLDDVARVALRHALFSFDLDQVSFGVDDGGGWRVVRRVRGELLDDADERLPPVWRRLAADSPAPLVAAAGGGVARFTDDGQPLAETALDRHDEKVRALAALPLLTPSLRGALTFGYRTAHGWLPAERALLTAAAELVAQAAERARRFETQHGTAQLLQRSMLPHRLPDVPRFRIAARYDPGVDGNSAGGDFYDAFTLPAARGRAELLAVVLGDVAGHDVRAAALMGQVRAALRALALTDPDPVTVLQALDGLVSSLSDETAMNELFATVLYGMLDPRTGSLTLASAGHPAPLLRRGRAGAHYVEVPPGPPLGLGGQRRAATMQLSPGDTLLLFSDGVIERRDAELDDGMRSLAAVIGEAPRGDPRTLCALATAAVSGSTEDDVAVLAIEHAITPSRSAVMEMPAEPTAPGRVRHWMTAQLTAWELPESVVGPAVLCTSELTTNALLHAGTPALVQIDLSSERLLISVADSGTRGAVTRARTETLSSRGRGLGLIEELSDAWGTDPAVRGSTVWFEILMPAGRELPADASRVPPPTAG
ncbi:ATP-binding SpoIIE family protein phosphatase [Micromonospora sp. NPDC049679]|uniref:ATP-binding SpoIIE family protein phosphatase n=1 Tax=Micromonospora sp. NPDC049679 TaxID=3155920 RepID=UPI0033DF25D6